MEHDLDFSFGTSDIHNRKQSCWPAASPGIWTG
jgi:hypothetical protein